MEKKEFNIIDAFLKYNKQMVILVSGLSGTNKSKICQNLSKELNIKYLNTRDFINTEKYEEIELPNKEKVKIWKEYKWDEIIDEINKEKENGVIVSGENFPKDNMGSLKIDIHLHIKLAKQNLIKRRLDYIHSLSDEEKNKFYSDDTESLIISQVVMPEYYDILQKSHINKFINANEYHEAGLKEEEFNEKITDRIFDEIIKHIVEFLKNKNLDKYIVS